MPSTSFTARTMALPKLLPMLGLGLVLGAWGLGTPRTGWAEGPIAPPPVPAAEPVDPAPLPLRTAVQQGLVAVRGLNPQSYQSLTLELSSLGKEPLEVDLAGSYMTPRGTKACQRLGLGPVITPGTGPKRRRPGTIVVTLKAGAMSTVRVATVCLDAGKSCPTTQEFQPAPDPLPPVRERVVRWWADHPEASQGDVNSAIWRDAEEVHVSGGRPTREPVLKLGVLHGQALYLVRDECLVARELDGSERFLATQIADVFPVKDALYAVAQVGEGQELWRYVETGDVLWKRLAPLPAGLVIASVTPVPGGGILISASTKILHLAPKASELRTVFTLPEGATQLSCYLASKRTAHLAFTLPPTKGVMRGGQQEQVRSSLPEIWELDLVGSRPPEKVKAYWNVASISQGAGGTFALTNAGHLRVLVGESFREQAGPPSLDEILHVGANHLWARTRNTSLVCIRIATGAYARVDKQLTELQHLRFDDVSGDAVAVFRPSDLVRIEADTGDCTVIVRRAGR